MTYRIRLLQRLVLLLLVSGCYQYVPVEQPAPLPAPGEEVRVRLASPQPLELGTITVQDIAMIEGDVYRTEADTLAVFSRKLYTTYGFKHETNGAVYFLPPSEIRLLEVRQLRPAQTALTAAALTGGTLLFFDLALGVFGGGGGPQGGGDPIDDTHRTAPHGRISFTIPAR